jgi:hypothetical protein
MIRKTLIAAAAAATLALGFGAATAPAQAGVHLYINGGHHGYSNPGYETVGYRVVCRWKKVYQYGYWKRVKVCKRVYYNDGY